MNIFLYHGTFGSGGFKSPFEKGVFSDISGSYINPPSPPFQRGVINPRYTTMAWFKLSPRKVLQWLVISLGGQVRRGSFGVMVLADKIRYSPIV